MSKRLQSVIITVLLTMSAVARTGWATDPVTIAPAPAGEQLSSDFDVSVEGQAVPVYRCRVSAVPLNQVWPGYQRPLDQTELASFACWDMAGGAEVKVHSRRLPIQTVAVRPLSLKIKPDVSGNTITFRLHRPCFTTVEVNGTVRNCFVRAFDDCIVLKGLKGAYDDRPVLNVDISGCVIWNDWGRALEIGAETCAPEIAQVVFRDCDIIRTVHIAMDIQHGDRAAVHDIRFENIRVEIDDVTPPPRMQQSKDEKYALDPKNEYCPELLVIHVTRTFYSKDDQRGTVRNVVFKDIAVTGRPTPSSRLQGLDADHGIDGVSFENIRVNNRPVTDAPSGRISIGAHVREVRFAAPRP